ncbi:MAG TPA: M48 family metalloprotease [Pyrinomonadaceae bacterium]|jgi:tetratricopeptide (TPR) repeat protein
MPNLSKRRSQIFFIRIFLLIAVFSCSFLTADAQPAGRRSNKKSQAERDEIKKVFSLLLDRVKPEERPKGFFWRPILIGPDATALNNYNKMIRELEMSEEWVIDTEQTINALAYYFPYESLEKAGLIASPPRRSQAEALRSEKVPVVVIGPKLVELLKNDAGNLDADRTAFLFGHELAHILKNHIMQELPQNARGKLMSREQEFEADAKGMELALKASFAKENGLKFYQAMERLFQYCSIEGQSLSHPSLKERLEALDQKQRELWRAMAAFDNGVFFLTVEQYDPAIEAFNRVVEQFPDSYEAWNNLGYAQLMKYCDALRQQDLNTLNIGQIVAGSFYERPASLRARIRGFDRELWNRAVISLQRGITKAGEQKIDLLLGKANMALAYLLKPDREESDIEEARRLFSESYSPDAFSKESFISRAAVLINSSVADLAVNDAGAALKKLDKVKAEYRLLSEQGELPQGVKLSAATDSILSAECFNRILAEMALAKDEESKKKAVAQTCQCIQKLPPASYWREIYMRLTGIKEPFSEDFECTVSTSSIRMVASIQVAPGFTLALGDKMPDIIRRLTAKRSKFDITGRQPRKISVRSFGLEVVGENEVLAIILNAEKSPIIKIRHRALGENSELNVGLSRTEVEKMIGVAAAQIALFYENQSDQYWFYPYAGLAVKYDLNEKVSELVVVQASRQ